MCRPHLLAALDMSVSDISPIVSGLSETEPAEGEKLLPGVLTFAQAARQLRKSERSIARYVRQGLLVAHRVGRTPYIDIEASRPRLRGEMPEPPALRPLAPPPAVVL